MEIFLFVILIVVLVVFFTRIIDKLNFISKKINNLENVIAKLKSSEADPTSKDPKTIPKPFEVKLPTFTERIIKEEKKEEAFFIEKPKEQEPVIDINLNPSPVKERPKTFSPPPPKIRKLDFWERNPDLEKFIGENLINKIGIGILVLGIGFFVKYAIDQEWINEFGRVAIGFVAGGSLIALAHRLRKTFAPFSSVLVGGGIAVFYFTISIAFHSYQIFNQTTAFVLMVMVTGFTIFLAYVYDRVELAVLAIIGGFTAPFLASTGEGNYVVLFVYLLILNSGMLALAYLKKWNLVNVVSYCFTIILYGGWLTTKVLESSNAPYGGALLFATLFYLVFFLMNIINNVKEKRKFNVLEISLILSNTFLYFSAGIIILDYIQEGSYKGLFTILIAVFNFIFVLFLYRRDQVDKNLVYLLIGLVLTFVSLAAPIQLKGNYITLFWALESVLLLWLSQKSGITLLRISSSVIVVLMLISLFMDWFKIYEQPEALMIILNKGFLTSFVCIGALIGNLKLLQKEPDLLFAGLTKDYYSIALASFLAITLYLSLLLEINFQIQTYVSDVHFRNLILGLYNYLFILAGFWFINKKESIVLRTIAIGAGLVASIVYLSFFQEEIVAIRNSYLAATSSLFPFLTHYILIIELLAIGGFINKLLVKVKAEIPFKRIYIWFFSFLIIFIVSAELINLILILETRDIKTIGERTDQIRKIGFPIIWGICSFVFMYLGMKYKLKDLRIISLTLFLITLLKLFIFDLSGISEGGKIAAFIILGVLLLVVSFMYQKLKVIILDEKPKDESA